jgi:hypothetical protein
VESNDAAAIARGMEELTAAQHKAAANLYQQAAPGQQRSADGPGTSEPSETAGKPEGGDVIDAEVVDEGKN